MSQPDFSPSAERNKQPILDVLRQVLPERGSALEIASGTGQHVDVFPTRAILPFFTSPTTRLPLWPIKTTYSPFSLKAAWYTVLMTLVVWMLLPVLLLVEICIDTRYPALFVLLAFVATLMG